MEATLSFAPGRPALALGADALTGFSPSSPGLGQDTPRYPGDRFGPGLVHIGDSISSQSGSSQRSYSNESNYFARYQHQHQNQHHTPRPTKQERRTFDPVGEVATWLTTRHSSATATGTATETTAAADDKAVTTTCGSVRASVAIPSLSHEEQPNAHQDAHQDPRLQPQPPHEPTASLDHHKAEPMSVSLGHQVSLGGQTSLGHYHHGHQPSRWSPGRSLDSTTPTAESYVSSRNTPSPTTVSASSSHFGHGHQDQQTHSHGHDHGPGSAAAQFQSAMSSSYLGGLGGAGASNDGSGVRSPSLQHQPDHHHQQQQQQQQQPYHHPHLQQPQHHGQHDMHVRQATIDGGTGGGGGGGLSALGASSGFQMYPPPPPPQPQPPSMHPHPHAHAHAHQHQRQHHQPPHANHRPLPMQQQHQGLPSPTHDSGGGMRLIPPPLPSQAGMSGLSPSIGLGTTSSSSSSSVYASSSGGSGGGGNVATVGGGHRGYQPYHHSTHAASHASGLPDPTPLSGIGNAGGPLAMVSGLGMSYGGGSSSSGMATGMGLASRRPMLYSHGHGALHATHLGTSPMDHHLPGIPGIPGMSGIPGMHGMHSMHGGLKGPGGASTSIHERPFKCDQCPQAFNRNHDLKRHKRIHLAIKPFPCNYCDKSFSRKDALKGCGDKQSADAAADLPVSTGVLSDTTSDGGGNDMHVLR